MKKLLLPILLLMMFIPFYVNAETCDTDKITIKDITIQGKSDNVKELEKATSSGKTINLNLSMAEEGDYIEYIVEVKNDSNDDFVLDKTGLNVSSDYISYSFGNDDNSNIVKANSTKNVTLRVDYINQVPEGMFESGLYSDNRTMMVQLSTNDTIEVPDTLKNPKTMVLACILLILVIVLLSRTIYVLLKKKKYAKLMSLLVVTTLIIPISVFALCKCDIKIDSNIKIVEPEKTIVNGSIIWEDENDYENLRPQSVNVILFSNGERIDSKSVSSDNNWNWSFENLLKYKNSEEIIYTIGIDSINNYDSIINDYTVTLSHDPVCVLFNNETNWSTIAKAVSHNNTSCMNLGDTKKVELGYYGIYNVRIANMSTPEECNSDDFSQTACGFVLEFTASITKNPMNLTGTNVGGWPNCYMRTFLNNNIYNYLPVSLRNVIVETKVVSGHGSTPGETNFVSYDKLYLPIKKETSSNTYYYDTAHNYSRTLDYYTNSSNVYCVKAEDDDGLWYRSAYSAVSGDFDMYCSWYGTDATDYRGVSPLFKIG